MRVPAMAPRREPHDIAVIITRLTTALCPNARGYQAAQQAGVQIMVA
jgi:hypothetical protein